MEPMIRAVTSTLGLSFTLSSRSLGNVPLRKDRQMVMSLFSSSSVRQAWTDSSVPQCFCSVHLPSAYFWVGNETRFRDFPYLASTRNSAVTGVSRTCLVLN
ncbi:hypothetical protein BJV78DRAFT_1237411 [Lactifluus subvellereus]|nr:hypothetical protein BJV78DRAFT_1237411 [Lactifluus subvellereus]